MHIQDYNKFNYSYLLKCREIRQAWDKLGQLSTATLGEDNLAFCIEYKFSLKREKKTVPAVVHDQVFCSMTY